MTDPARDRHPERLASFVVGERVYYVTTIIWVNAWDEERPETGISDGTRGWGKIAPFTLIQHDAWPIGEIHAEVVQLLKLEMTPEQVHDEIYRRHRSRGMRYV